MTLPYQNVYKIVYHSCVPLSDKVHVLQKKNMLWERTVGINNTIASFLCNQENYFYNTSENKKILCSEN